MSSSSNSRARRAALPLVSIAARLSSAVASGENAVSLPARAISAARIWCEAAGAWLVLSSESGPRIAVESLGPTRAHLRIEVVEEVCRTGLPFRGRDGEGVSEAPPSGSVLCLPLRSSCSSSVARASGCLYLDGGAAALPLEPEEEELLCAVAALAAATIGPPPDRIKNRLATGSSAPTAEAGRSRAIPTAPPPRGVSRLVGRSESIRQIRDLVRRLARSSLPVLIAGESGTGKEAVSRALHEESGRPGPFVAENCAALPDTLVESLLFGHVRGAFTGADRDHDGLFAQASGGTLFLDEIGEMPPSLQAKLLRALQEREIRPVGGRVHLPVDVRVVAATNRDLRTLVSSGRLRKDLYYRLAGMTIELPPLRERLEDIPLLLAHFLGRHEALTGGGGPDVPPRTLRALLEYDWPGNVRELSNEIERLVALSEGPSIPPEALSAALRGRVSTEASVNAGEKRMIERALIAAEGRITRAAREIGWNRQKLYRRMVKLGVRAGFGAWTG